MSVDTAQKYIDLNTWLEKVQDPTLNDLVGFMVLARRIEAHWEEIKTTKPDLEDGARSILDDGFEPGAAATMNQMVDDVVALGEQWIAFANANPLWFERVRRTVPEIREPAGQ